MGAQFKDPEARVVSECVGKEHADDGNRSGKELADKDYDKGERSHQRGNRQDGH